MRDRRNEIGTPLDLGHCWVEDLRGEDQQALDRLVAFYRLYLGSLVGTLIPEGMQGRGDQSDLIQETLIRGLANRDQFRGATNS